MNLLFFQHGDYGAAYRAFQDGQPETYRDQKSSVNFVAKLAGCRIVTTIAICERSYEEELTANLFATGIELRASYDKGFIDQILARSKPDLIVCRTPNLPVLNWAAQRQVPTLPIFADIFLNTNPRSLMRNLRLRQILRKGRFPCVANHSLNASLSVTGALHWPEKKVVPWDWTRLQVEDQPKGQVAHLDRPTALFCGALVESKGLGDCLESLAILKNNGCVVQLTVAGPGNVQAWKDRATTLGLEEQVDFIGLVAHSKVRTLMREVDIVLVPSRHDYDEGMPNTIYEALAARTPVLVSDHPAFRGRLKDGRDTLVFRAAKPASMARSVTRLLNDQTLYQRLSRESREAHSRLYVGMEFEHIIQTFLRDPKDETGWVLRNSLSGQLS